MFTSFYKAHRSKLRKHDSYAYKLKNLSDLFVKSQQKVKPRLFEVMAFQNQKQLKME